MIYIYTTIIIYFLLIFLYNINKVSNIISNILKRIKCLFLGHKYVLVGHFIYSNDIRLLQNINKKNYYNKDYKYSEHLECKTCNKFHAHFHNISDSKEVSNLMQKLYISKWYKPYDKRSQYLNIIKQWYYFNVICLNDQTFRVKYKEGNDPYLCKHPRSFNLFKALCKEYIRISTLK